MLFASFDYANASSFKYRHEDWPDLYYEILCVLSKRLCKRHIWCFWKANGDELLFYRKVDKAISVERQVELVDKVMAEEIRDIHGRGTHFRNIQHLSIKKTLWISGIRQYVRGATDIGNANDFLIAWDGKTDFFGKEMDIAFRISKYVPRSKTALSAALAYYLIKRKSPITKRIRIVGYQKLKGVLHEKRYPIIWLFRAKSAGRMKKSFHYDEEYENELVRNFLQRIRSDKGHGRIDPKEFGNALEYLDLKGTTKRS